MADLKQIGIKVNATGLKPAADGLDKLGKAATNADGPVRAITKTLEDFSSNGFKSVTTQVNDLAKSFNAIKTNASGFANIGDMKGISQSFTNIANATERLVQNESKLAQVVAHFKSLRTELEGMSGLSTNVPKIGSSRLPGTPGNGGRSVGGGDDSGISAAGKRTLAQLEREAYMVNHTRAEYLEYRAAKYGVTKEAAPFVDALKKGNSQMNNMGMSAKQLNASLRGVPAQFTDIVVSLQGGQNPLTVFLQQGGQLKDMFGGMGNAAKALGGYIVGLINPFTIAAGVVAALGYAFYKGSEQNKELAISLAKTNGITGLTVSSMNEMVSVLKQQGANASDASSAVSGLASNAKIADSAFMSSATAITNFANAVGATDKEVSALTKEFESLGSKPTESIVKLNEKYHFLTLSIYDQIKALEAQGKEQEAVALAQNTFAAATETMAQRAEGSIGSIERGWIGVKNAVSDVVSEMAKIGKSDTQTKLEALNRQIEQYGGKGIGAMAAESPALKQLKQQRDNLLEVMRIESRAAAEEQRVAQIEQNATNAATALDKKRATLGLDTQKRLQNALAENAKLVDDMRKKDPNDYRASESYLKELNDATTKSIVKDKSAQMAARAAKVESAFGKESAGLLEQLDLYKQRTNEIIQFGSEVQPINQHLIEAAKQQAMAADKNLTTEQRSNAQKIANIQLELAGAKSVMESEMDAAKVKETALKKQQDSWKSYYEMFAEQEQLQNSIVEGYQQEISYLTMSNKEKETASRYWQMELKYKREIAKIDGEIAADPTKAEVGKAKKRLLEETMALEIAGAKQYDKLRERGNTFVQDTDNAFKSFQDGLQSRQQAMESFFSSSFDKMSDAFGDFVTTGKMDFRSFASSVVSDLAKVLAKMALVESTKSLFANSSTGSMGSLIGSLFGFANGGAFGMKGPYAFADGGTFTNSVVNRPTAFASGGMFGVMGEAGPEAIMPLQRGPNGKLGVQAYGGGGAGNVTVMVNVTNESNSTTSSSDSQDSRLLGQALGNRIKQVILEEKRPGGILA